MNLLEINNIVKNLEKYNNIDTFKDQGAKYVIPEDSKEMFQNIVKFALGTESKDSRLISEFDNNFNIDFANLLIDYHFSELTKDDVIKLLNLTANYNETFLKSLSTKEGLISFLDYNFSYSKMLDQSLALKIKQFIINEINKELEKPLEDQKLPYDQLINLKNMSDHNINLISQMYILNSVLFDSNSANQKPAYEKNTSYKQYFPTDQKLIIKHADGTIFDVLDHNNNFVFKKKLYENIKYTFVLPKFNESDTEETCEIIFKKYLYKMSILEGKINPNDIPDAEVDYTLYYHIIENGKPKDVTIIYTKPNPVPSENDFEDVDYENNGINYITDLLNKSTLFGSSQIKSYFNTFKKSFIIPVYFKQLNKSMSINEKLSANQREKRMLYDNALYSSFNIIISARSTDLQNAVQRNININQIINPTQIYNEYVYHKELSLYSENKTMVGIGIMYKEFNPILREIGFLDLVDPLISELNIFNTDESNSQEMISLSIMDDFLSIVSSDLTDKSKGFYNVFYNNDLFHMLSSLKFNPYKARRASESEIIRYFEGPFLKYGINDTEKEEIDLFLTLYEEVRDYFYKILLNKSLIREDNYSPMEKLYLMTTVIERFIGEKVNHLKDIALYNSTDIHNFLISYGLKALDEIKFSTALSSKKKLIYHYKDLMKMKGSDDVVQILLDSFNSEDIEVNIFKYLMFPYFRTSTDKEASYIRIAPIDYINNEIPLSVEQITGNIEYVPFIESTNDLTWNLQNVPESYLCKLIKGPTPTKYSSIAITKKLLEAYSKYKYSISFAHFLKHFKKKEEMSYPDINPNINIKLTKLNFELTNLDLYHIYYFLIKLYNIYINSIISKNKNESLDNSIDYNVDFLLNSHNNEYAFSNKQLDSTSNEGKGLNKSELDSIFQLYTFTEVNNKFEYEYSPWYKKFLNNLGVISNSPQAVKEIPYIIKSMRALLLLQRLSTTTDISKIKKLKLDYLQYNQKEIEAINKNTMSVKDLLTEIPEDTFYTTLFTELSYFPLKYTSGYFFSLDNNTNLINKITDYYNKYFVTEIISNNPNSSILYSYINNDFNTESIEQKDQMVQFKNKISQIHNWDERIDACSSSILDITEELANYYYPANESLIINLGLKEDNKAFSRFVYEAVKLFLSYTSFLYTTTFTELLGSPYQNYKTSYNLATDHITSVQVEYLFYDEKIKITNKNIKNQ